MLALACYDCRVMLIDTLRKCSKCNVEKEDVEFEGNRITCKQCRRKRQAVLRSTPEFRAERKIYRSQHPEQKKRDNARQKERYAKDEEYRNRINAAQRRNRKASGFYRKRTLRKYGLTQEMEDRILEKQKHRCLTCRRKFQETNCRLHRDHDHALGHFRGFLCNHCNVIVGMAEGTGCPEKTLEGVLEYIRNTSLFYSARALSEIT
jgi:Recombination endonuclease VII